jgi:hypothetical protein
MQIQVKELLGWRGLSLIAGAQRLAVRHVLRSRFPWL